MKTRPELVDRDSDVLTIDQTRLDEEWMRQPKLLFTYAEKAANARRELDESKAALDLCFAELDKLIRNDPADYGCDKITEKAVEACIHRKKAYKEALRRVHEAKYAVDIFQAMVSALEHKKKGLEKMVELFAMDYFSSPRASQEAGEVVKEMERKVLRRGIIRHVEAE